LGNDAAGAARTSAQLALAWLLHQAPLIPTGHGSYPIAVWRVAQG
jgi:aryl-alcohol dehydrogenase-like predicted oxidoreductase